MYLATEGLYAEIISSKTGIAESLQAQGIMIAGPSTVTALLNSLAMGFKTVAINKRQMKCGKFSVRQKHNMKNSVSCWQRHAKGGRSRQNFGRRRKPKQNYPKNLKTVESLSADKAEQILGLEFENEE